MTLVDSNVLLDVVTDGEAWADWSQEQLEQAASSGPLVINDVIYAEVSTRYATVEGVDAMLRNLDIDLAAIPRSCALSRGQGLPAVSQRRRSSHRRAGGFLHWCPRRCRTASAADTRRKALSNLFPDGRTDYAGTTNNSARRITAAACRSKARHALGDMVEGLLVDRVDRHLRCAIRAGLSSVPTFTTTTGHSRPRHHMGAAFGAEFPRHRLFQVACG